MSSETSQGKVVIVVLISLIVYASEDAMTLLGPTYQPLSLKHYSFDRHTF